MKILIDVFGSDHPEELIAGCARCSLEVPEATLVLPGREDVLRPALEALPHDPARIEHSGGHEAERFLPGRRNPASAPR